MIALIVRIKPEFSKPYYAEVPIDYDEDNDDTYETALLVEDWIEENCISAESYDILGAEEAEDVEERGLL